MIISLAVITVLSLVLSGCQGVGQAGSLPQIQTPPKPATSCDGDATCETNDLSVGGNAVVRGSVDSDSVTTDDLTVNNGASARNLVVQEDVQARNVKLERILGINPQPPVLHVRSLPIAELLYPQQPRFNEDLLDVYSDALFRKGLVVESGSVRVLENATGTALLVRGILKIESGGNLYIGNRGKTAIMNGSLNIGNKLFVDTLKRNASSTSQNAYVCVYADGQLYRSAVPCV